MILKTILIAAVGALIALGGGPGPLSASMARAACEPGVKLDKSTVEQTRQKLESLGYLQANHLKKGCDNYWYGYAMKDGAEVHLSLSPSGEVHIQHE